MTQSYGIKVAKKGKSALSESDKDLQFTTKYSTLKIFSKGNTNFTTNGSGNGAVDIAHNFGYPPAFLAFRKCTASWPFLDSSSYPNSYLPGLGSSNQWDDDNKNFALVGYTSDNNISFRAISASPSKIYYFKYYTLVDLAQDFSGAGGPSLTKNLGFKVAKQGINVLTAKEYELAYSSKYQALQYYVESIKTAELTLPAMWSSKYDPEVEEGTYVDFLHGLGYPPLFFGYFITTNAYIETPYSIINSSGNVIYEVSGFCDATRVRISFWRKSTYAGGENYPETTIFIKVYIFTENLNLN